jgi:hypothetical protein
MAAQEYFRMHFAEGLVECIRTLLADQVCVREVRTGGGLCFMADSR